MSFKKVVSIVCLSMVTLLTGLQAGGENLFSVHREAALSGAAGTPWSAARHIELVETAAALAPELIGERGRMTYPISETNLQQIYSDAKDGTVSFFTYSSMIDKEAGAVKAISPCGASTQTAAIAFGLQRTFNRQMAAETVEKGWGPLARPNDVAILNVFEKQDAVLNGVVFQLPLADLLVLTRREIGYDVVPVLAMRWSDALDEQKQPEIFLAYTLMAPDFTIEGTPYTNSAINPIPGYFSYLQKGLFVMGRDYTAMWWATTYLADQKTRVDELPYRIIDLKRA